MRLRLRGMRLRMCLCRGRSVSESHAPALPPREAVARLSQWLRGPRSRALRRAAIGHRRRLLDAGAGWGTVTAELAHRCAGKVTALDHSPLAVATLHTSGIPTVAGDFQTLPFGDEAFDLVFFQNTLLWSTDLSQALAEAARVLQPGGTLVALEPDYGGMMEHPDRGLGVIWRAALRRAGADPEVGRKLAGACEIAGLQAGIELVPVPRPFGIEALSLLEGLQLTAEENTQLAEIARHTTHATGHWAWFVHLPYFVVVADKS